MESEIFFFFNKTETHEKTAYLASEAQFTYWGTLSFSLLLLNPYPLHLSRLLPNKYLCSVPMLTLWGIIYQHLLWCFGGEA